MSPSFGRILAAAKFIPLDKRVSEEAVQRSVATAKAGTPLMVSLTEGYTAIGVAGHERPRSGGVRIAHLAGADIFPVFAMIEEGKRVKRSFRGKGGGEEVFTTFSDTLYFLSFLPPIPATAFKPEESITTYRAVAEDLQRQSDREGQRITALLGDERGRFEAIRRRGGSDTRVRW